MSAHPSRREFLRQVGLAAFAPFVLVRSEAQWKGRFNVLFIAVDDLNRRLGCFGDPVAKTPHIDRIAQRGVIFRRAYCQYPLCNPTRTSLLSGLYPEATKIMDNNTLPRTYLGDDFIFLPQHFRQHGYFTMRIGKIYHGGMDDKASWDISEETPRRIAPRQQREKKAAKEKQAVKAKQQAQTGVAPLQWQATENEDWQEPDGAIARRAVQLLREHIKQRGKQPFFLAVGFHKPHLPWIAPKRYFDLHDPAKMPLPKTPPDDLKDIPPIALTKLEQLTEEQHRLAMRAYYACVSFMDAQVGVLLEALDELGLWDETVIVLWGDHGFHLGEHGGLWRKMSLFEESAGAPLLFAVPGKARGRACDRIVEFLDIYPTLCELCQLPKPKHQLHGESLVPLLDNPQASWDNFAVTVVRRGKGLGRSIRTERWRYTEWDEGRLGVELYDHANDPNEWRNLAADPKFADVVSELKEKLHKAVPRQ